MLPIPPPTPVFQVAFLQKVQRILAEGSFVATYKFALLHALADLAVLKGDGGGGGLTLTTYEIAEKFVELYWRQAIPYPGREQIGLLRQNTDRQAAVINAVESARRQQGGSLALAKWNAVEWKRLVKKVERVVKEQPLWKLQIVGREPLDFLYPNVGRGRSIALRPGIAFCLRTFYEMVIDLIRGGWIRHLRGCNGSLLGDRAELSEFLFGLDRESLTKHREIFTDLQEGACFYCQRQLRGLGQVDHFVPWSLYPVDLGHNFVLAHDKCNNSKSDRLADVGHLERWCLRNEEHGVCLAEGFDEREIIHDLSTSMRITTWAYERLETVSGQTWTRGRDGLGPLDPAWRSLLARAA